MILRELLNLINEADASKQSREDIVDDLMDDFRDASHRDGIFIATTEPRFNDDIYFEDAVALLYPNKVKNNFDLSDLSDVEFAAVVKAIKGKKFATFTTYASSSPAAAMSLSAGVRDVTPKDFQPGMFRDDAYEDFEEDDDGNYIDDPVLKWEASIGKKLGISDFKIPRGDGVVAFEKLSNRSWVIRVSTDD